MDEAGTTGTERKPTATRSKKSWEERWREWTNGTANGPGAATARGILWCFSRLYDLITRCRNAAYTAGLFRTHRVAYPVCGVGNLTVGGTGKTPVVAWIVDELRRQGAVPGIISRGYGAIDETASGSRENDEKRVLARRCPGVPHEQSPDRLAAVAELQKVRPVVTHIVADDVYQHRRLHRDLNILLIDATDPWGGGYLLPRGRLRESQRGIDRADAVLITRCDLVADEGKELRTTLLNGRRDLSDHVYRTRFVVTDVVAANGQTKSAKDIRGQVVYLATAIGNPTAFRRTVEQLGGRVAGEHIFPDHHHFTGEDIRGIRERTIEVGAKRILVTEKDLVKTGPLSETGERTPPFEALVIRLDFVEAEEEARFSALLKSKLRLPSETAAAG